ncbi:Peptidoglycan/LPS O-acetylase OafA/YrhL, contains acyltransferase and SGNH-hydrolase domains [Paenibacillus sp. yr247]|uniref:acyltransferase family protein n=1 Tax=Paenibacillus sp. yr247 TaxID=1761880 RepID=UPI00088E44A6|nr:acyltransferase [Paenibacillus sp. yr247]SDN34501.1 Peptidoglycan/LPS O-acetylase OafA/YrhL, contains acyltransferase and SGNH-hydrolase domains [Paenibacillus sp. yr247]
MNKNQRIVLQASRGAAAFFVLLFHTSAMSFKYFQYDFLGISAIGRSGGVDFFFLLTGFLLYHTYGHKIGTKMTVLPYLTNRLIRIYPFYWLITLVVLPVYFLVPSFGYGYETHKDTIIKSFLLLPQAHGPVLPVAWSLSYFVLFYLVFSFLMALGRKPAYLFVSIWMTLTLCHFLNVPLIGADIDRHFYLNFLFSGVNLEFIAGCLLAKWAEHHRNKHYKQLIVIGALGFALIWLNNKYLLFPYHNYLLYIIPATCVLLGASSVPEQLRLPYWVKSLSKLGNASYTILLTHLLFISILMKLSVKIHVVDHLGYLLTDLIIMALTVPLCYMVYRLAEKPLVTGLKNAIKLSPSKSSNPIS